MSHEFSDTCVACRAATALGLTERSKIDLLHAAAQHLIDYQMLIQRSKEVGFDVLDDDVTDVLADHVFIEAPAPATHH